MGASSLGGPERPRTAQRSIRFTFAVMVLVPAFCLALLWSAVMTAPFDRTLVGHGLSLRNHRQLAEHAVLIAAGIVVILVAVMVMGSFARRLSRDIAALTAAAQHLEDEQLPHDGEQSPQSGDRPLGGVHAARPRTAEVARAAAAIASLGSAVGVAAASEASLRDGLRLVIVSMARRNQSLLQRQLRLIDALEQKASDPAALADLFSLDHLTTRMRRHAESLTILSGSAPARSWREPIPVIDVIRGAMAEVEDYTRVSVVTHTGEAVAGSAAADMIHLLAELMENATMFSPSGTAVEVRAGRVANGYAIEIDDRGLGIESGQLNELNEKLALPPDFDLASADRLGLFVAAKLAARYGVRVSLRPSPYGGTTAIVLMPNHIVVPASAVDADPQPGARPAMARPAGLNLRGGSGLALVGQRQAPSALSVTPQPGAAQPGAGQPGAAQSRSGRPVGGDSYRGLPRRIRQANLSPHLKDNPPASASSADAGLLAAPPGIRPPEQARDLAASLQGGWRRGREEGTPDPAPAPPVPDTGTAATPAAERAAAGDSARAARKESVPPRNEEV
ncbi:MAG TPA: ATP-binding protein [Streptosporangiaceae bacterium]|nr:ATP-binding protein [Streptosporangiaceae bacterium]